MKLTAAEAQALAAAQARDATLEGARKRSEGIVHTPPELARFVAGAVDGLLSSQLGLRGGLADPQVALIDPASGPGAFFAAAHAVAGERTTQPRAVIALERDARSLPQLDVGWPIDARHVDTLLDVQPHTLAGAAPVLAVLGNPPWVGAAQAKPVAWLDALLDELRRDGSGARLQERKLGVLADAYVRFLAWTLAAARAAEQGAVVGLVTNGSYLDGPVHRGLRAALLRSFDALWVVDLGGNALLAREGAADGNVFGVRTSVAVLLGVRRRRAAGEAAPLDASVQYARLHGPARDKLEQLAGATLDALSFRALRCTGPAYRFVPEPEAPPEYLAWPSLAELMPFHREGVQTNRDAVAIGFDREQLLARLRAFAAGESRDDLAEAERALPHYDPELARAAVREALQRSEDACVQRIAYRPFDSRWYAPIAPLCHRPRAELQAAMRRSGLALVTARKDRGSAPWRHAAVAAEMIDNCFLSTRSSCRARAFPTHTGDGAPNLEPRLHRLFEEQVERTLHAEELAAYVLACLSSPHYQTHYATWLRVDYPRVPIPRDGAAFEKLRALGERLTGLLLVPLSGPIEKLEEHRPDDRVRDLTIGHQRVLDRFASGRRELARTPDDLVRLRFRLDSVMRVLDALP